MCCSLNKFSRHFFGGLLARSASPRRKGGGSLFLTNRRKRPSPFSPLLQIGTQLHVGATARQGRLRERECVVGLFFISRGGGEGQQGPRPLTPENQKKPFSKKKTLFQFQVRVVIDKRNGTEFACKSIPKRLDAPGLAPERQAAHVDNIRREVAVLRRLRGTLNVVALEGAFEDADSAHIVMVQRAFV